jgi:hypothetical protein
MTLLKKGVISGMFVQKKNLPTDIPLESQDILKLGDTDIKAMVQELSTKVERKTGMNSTMFASPWNLTNRPTKADSL